MRSELILPLFYQLLSHSGYSSSSCANCEWEDEIHHWIFFNIVCTHHRFLYLLDSHTDVQTASFPLPLSFQSYVNAQDSNLTLTQNGPFFPALSFLSLWNIYVVDVRLGRPSCPCSSQLLVCLHNNKRLLNPTPSHLSTDLAFQGIFLHVVIYGKMK